MAYDRTLVHIRERQFLDVLDLAVVVVRDRPVTLAAAALAGIAPFAALNAWLLQIPEFSVVLFVYLVILEVPWATAPLTIVLGGLMFGERPTVRRVVKTLLRSFVPMVLYQTLVRGMLMFLFVTYPLIPTRLAFLDEVILLERGNWRTVVRRNAQLCEQREGELFGQWLAQVLFGGVFVLAFWAGLGAIFQSLFSGEITWEPAWNDLFDARLQVGLWIAIAFFGVVRFLAYIDQRIRLEGWEVELRLRAAGETLEDAMRW